MAKSERLVVILVALDVTKFRTVCFGPDSVLVTADLVFDAHITEIERLLREHEPLIGEVYIEPEIESSATDSPATDTDPVEDVVDRSDDFSDA